MKPLALISVIVPMYNDRRYVADCIASVQRQTDVPFEVVVVDDCGTDKSADVVRKLMAEDERIRLIRHDRNRGLAASRNTGIAFASGQFVTFLDADDFLFANSLFKRARRLRYKSRRDATIAGCYCGWEMVPEDANIDWQPTAESKTTRLRYLDIAGKNPLIATAPLLWRRVAVDVGGFDESFRTAEDFEFWTRLLRQGYELIPCGLTGVAYRQKTSSMVADDLTAHATSAARVLDYVDRPLASGEVSRGAPSAFRLSVADHRRQQLFLGRLAVFLAIAIGSNNDAERDGLLELVPPTARVSDLDGASGLERSIAAGVRRFELQTDVLSDTDRAALTRQTREVLLEYIDAVGPHDDSDEFLEFPLDTIYARATEVGRSHSP